MYSIASFQLTDFFKHLTENFFFFPINFISEKEELQVYGQTNVSRLYNFVHERDKKAYHFLFHILRIDCLWSCLK